MNHLNHYTNHSILQKEEEEKKTFITKGPCVLLPGPQIFGGHVWSSYKRIKLGRIYECSFQPYKHKIKPLIEFSFCSLIKN